jgi:hypothetical protein
MSELQCRAISHKTTVTYWIVFYGIFTIEFIYEDVRDKTLSTLFWDSFLDYLYMPIMEQSGVYGT